MCLRVHPPFPCKKISFFFLFFFLFFFSFFQIYYISRILHWFSGFKSVGVISGHYLSQTDMTSKQQTELIKKWFNSLFLFCFNLLRPHLLRPSCFLLLVFFLCFPFFVFLFFLLLFLSWFGVFFISIFENLLGTVFIEFKIKWNINIWGVFRSDFLQFLLAVVNYELGINKWKDVGYRKGERFAREGKKMEESVVKRYIGKNGREVKRGGEN